MLISEIRKKKTFENINLSPDFIDDSVVFSAHKLAINSKNFKGGRINVAFGTTTLILNSAEIAEGQHVLEVSAVFGSVKILTPQGMNVKLINSSVLGQFNDRRIYPSSNEDTKLLIIKSNVVFAGGDLI